MLYLVGEFYNVMAGSSLPRKYEFQIQLPNGRLNVQQCDALPRVRGRLGSLAESFTTSRSWCRTSQAGTQDNISTRFHRMVRPANTLNTSLTCERQ